MQPQEASFHHRERRFLQINLRVRSAHTHIYNGTFFFKKWLSSMHYLHRYSSYISYMYWQELNDQTLITWILLVKEKHGSTQYQVLTIEIQTDWSAKIQPTVNIEHK